MIEIIEDKIKKTFDYKDEDNQSFLKNEVFWLNYLKGKWVPEQSTDYIFCTIGEEWGLIGTSLVIFLFIALIFRIVQKAEMQRSKMSRVYGYCVASIFFIHFLMGILKYLLFQVIFSKVGLTKMLGHF